jgi:hypothetical protein
MRARFIGRVVYLLACATPAAALVRTGECPWLAWPEKDGSRRAATPRAFRAFLWQRLRLCFQLRGFEVVPRYFREPVTERTEYAFARATANRANSHPLIVTPFPRLEKEKFCTSQSTVHRLNVL